MDTPKELKEVDWVTERSKCTAGQIFDLLKAEVDKDVKTRQSSIPQGHYGGLNIYVKTKEFGVSLHGINYQTGTELHKTVRFALEGNSIVVVDENLSQRMKATVSLGDDGRCRLKVGEEELESWQFRRRALEDLLFDPTLP